MRLSAAMLLLAGCSAARAAAPAPEPRLERPRQATEALRLYVGEALELFRGHHRGYPSGRPGLSALFGTYGIGRGPYLEGRPPILDGWGREFRYDSDGRTYRLVSAGEDGRFDTADDIAGGTP